MNFLLLLIIELFLNLRRRYFMKTIEWVENKKITNSEKEILGFDKKSIIKLCQTIKKLL